MATLSGSKQGPLAPTSVPLSQRQPPGGPAVGFLNRSEKLKRDVNIRSDTHTFFIQFGNLESWFIGGEYGNAFTLASGDNPANEQPIRFWTLRLNFSSRTGGITLSEKFLEPSSGGQTFIAQILNLVPKDFDFQLLSETETNWGLEYHVVEISLHKHVAWRTEVAQKPGGLGLPGHLNVNYLKSTSIHNQRGQVYRMRVLVAESSNVDMDQMMRILNKEFVQAKQLESLPFIPAPAPASDIGPESALCREIDGLQEADVALRGAVTDIEAQIDKLEAERDDLETRLAESNRALGQARRKAKQNGTELERCVDELGAMRRGA